ncbi:FkbM family methyltransferase [Paludibaculum fermentans]|uniref:FkbM family methyltransferase n=1 Tax=Paludibaculum fermentans TaxID=1473598 RepID=UPI003EBF0178
MSLLSVATNISAYFQWDLAYRFLMRMPALNRRELAWRILQREHTDSASFRVDGFVWNAPVTLGVPLVLFRSGCFQGEEVCAMIDWIRHQELLQPGRDTIIDVGANIGTTSLPMIRGLGCRILAIEPEPRNLHFLRKNLEDNGLSNLACVAPCAILREPGTISLLQPTEDPGGFCVDRARIRAEMGQSALNGAVDVRADRLDSVATEQGFDFARIALVWSDTQGCEEDVMVTGAEFWSRGAPLYTEVEPLSLRRQGVYNTIAGVAAQHFDRYIEAKDIVSLGAAAPVHPICEFASYLANLPGINADVLFLPPNCQLKT